MARGVTIIEILVVLAIFAIVSGVVFFNFKGLNDVVYLERLTHDIASQIEEAKRAAISGENPFLFTGKPSYGVHFDRSVSPNTITYFADQDNDSFFDDPGELLGTSLSPQTGYGINKICVNNTTSLCSLSNRNNLTVVFTRPFPDAVLSAEDSLGAIDKTISNAQIEVISPDNLRRTITVRVTGQVSVR